jgi:hypothetical protein
MHALTRDTAQSFVGDKLNVGYDDDTDSYGPVSFDSEGEMVDSGIRISFGPYGTVEGAIEKKAKRIAMVNITVGDTIKLRIGGIYVNMMKDGSVYCQWPSIQYGNINHLEGAFDGEQISLVPLVVLGFFQWLEENDASKEVRDWVNEHASVQ